MEGDIEKDSEAKSTYTDLKARRPVIHKVRYKVESQNFLDLF